MQRNMAFQKMLRMMRNQLDAGSITSEANPVKAKSQTVWIVHRSGREGRKSGAHGHGGHHL